MQSSPGRIGRDWDILHQLHHSKQPCLLLFPIRRSVLRVYWLHFPTRDSWFPSLIVFLLLSKTLRSFSSPLDRIPQGPVSSATPCPPLNSASLITLLLTPPSYTSFLLSLKDTTSIARFPWWPPLPLPVAPYRWQSLCGGSPFLLPSAPQVPSPVIHLWFHVISATSFVSQM